MARCKECNGKHGNHKMDCSTGRMERAMVKPDKVCASCGHMMILKGDPNTSQYWQCIRNCRCTMQGCVPEGQDYGTRP